MKKILLFIVVFLLFSCETNATSIEDSLNSISSKIKQLKEETAGEGIAERISKKYPVGSIYISTSSTNPGTVFGGTWVAFAEGRTLLGVASDGTAGESSSVSSSNISLTTTANLPAHTHTYTASGSITSTFSGTASNTSTTTETHNHAFAIKKSGAEASGYGLLYSSSAGFVNRVSVDDGASGLSWVINNDHTHSVTAAGSVSSSFTGTKAVTSSIGSGTSFSVLNPYVTVYMWKRTA